MPRFTLVSGRSPRYATPSNNSVLLLAKFKELPHAGEIWFHAHPEDTEPHGSEIFQRAMNEEFGPVAPCTTSPAQHLENTQKELCRHIDAAAQRAHSVLLSDTRSPIYAHTLEEAKRHAKDDDPRDSDYPLLHARIGHDGKTVAEVGQRLLEQDIAWRKKAAEIERKRLGVKKAVANSVHVDQARDVFNSVKF